jgi:hypothetical protein
MELNIGKRLINAIGAGSANLSIVAKNDMFTLIFAYRLIQLECNGSCLLRLLLQPEMGNQI